MKAYASNKGGKKNREGGRVVQPSCIDEGGGVGGEESND